MGGEGAMTPTWERIEAGWYVREGVGGICRERDGRWWFWPLHGDGPPRKFRTLAEAIAVAGGSVGSEPETKEDV